MGKKSLPWFPCYADDWLKDTRTFSDMQSRVYWDFICVLYKNNGSIADSDKWIAYELHCSIQKWRSVRKFLEACGKVVVSPDGTLTNPRVAQVCQAREERSAELSAKAGRREQTRYQNPELPLNINRGGSNQVVRLVAVNEHLKGEDSDLQIQNPDKEIEELKARKPIPPDIMAVLVRQAGQERATALTDEYYRDRWGAQGAESIRKAFPGWLEKAGIILEGLRDGRTNPRALAEEIVKLCDGNTALPSAAQLAARKRDTG